MTPLPTPAVRTWLHLNYENYNRYKLCVTLGIGSKQLELWEKNMGLKKRKTINKK